MQRSKNRSLFDHLIGEGKHRRWQVQSECLGTLKVYDKLEFRRLFDRQHGGIGSLENSSDVDPNLTVNACKVSPIAHEPTRLCKFARCKDGGNAARRAALTGSSPVPKTIGMVAVAALATLKSETRSCCACGRNNHVDLTAHQVGG
jgi:hypothetical protein